MTTKTGIDLSDPDAVQQTVELDPEEEAAHQAMLAQAAEVEATAARMAEEDAELRRLIGERAADDPAFAALSALVLRARR